MHPEYQQLTETEKAELDGAITTGRITRSCPRIRRDWFRLTLANGTRVCGAYTWDTDNGEFDRLTVTRPVRTGHSAQIGRMTVRSRYPFIVYSDVRGFIGQHRAANAAERTLKADRRGCGMQGGYSDASVYEWSGDFGWRQIVDFEGDLTQEYADGQVSP